MLVSTSSMSAYSSPTQPAVKKYASDPSNIDMAEVCYETATEFQQTALPTAKSFKHSARALGHTVFDLLLGRAECAWERRDHFVAKQLVTLGNN